MRRFTPPSGARKHPTSPPLMAATESSSDDTRSPDGDGSRRNEQPSDLNVIETIFGRCFCADAKWMLASSTRPSVNVVTLDGIECIGLGAVTDEQTAMERVSRTVMQLKSNTERLISVGYLMDVRKESNNSHSRDSQSQIEKITELIPLEAWRGNGDSESQQSPSYSEQVLPLAIGTAIEYLKQNEFDQAVLVFEDMLRHQRENKVGDNVYLEGITIHNIGVVHLLAGKFDKAFPRFKEAIRCKRATFGHDHPEVTISLVETGIQLFAMDKFEEALQVFNEALRIRIRAYGSDNPKVAMVLNNIACVHFKMGNPLAALGTFKEARDIQQVALGSSQKADLDLLHVATTLGNIGYIQLQVKSYEDARTILEDALLVQQSVLGDDHKAVKDTLSNIDFANAFHS